MIIDQITNSAPEESWLREGFDASSSFAAQLAEVDGLKTFPIVAQKTLVSLSNPDFRVSDISDLLTQDPSLATGVLRMANSAFFAGTREVSSITQAFIRLGRRSVQEVVAAVATMDLFPDTDGIGKRIRDHCAATAAIAQTIAKEFAPGFVEGIFLCGLLHDVAKMLLIESHEFDYTLVERDVNKPDAIHKEEQEILGYDHAILGACVLDRWKIPAPIPWVIAWHHQPDKAYDSDHVGTMVSVLRIADQLEYIATNHEEDYEVKINQLWGSKDLGYIDIEPVRLIEMWEQIVEARTKALKLFGS